MATPVTTPESVLIVATDGVLVFHMPPEKVLESVIELPTATVLGPDIIPALGLATTVMIFVAETAPHPPAVVVWVMVVVPAATPVTTPVLLIVATPTALLVHVPMVPLTVDESAMVPPMHTLFMPVIESITVVVTVTTLVAHIRY